MILISVISECVYHIHFLVESVRVLFKHSLYLLKVHQYS